MWKYLAELFRPRPSSAGDYESVKTEAEEEEQALNHDHPCPTCAVRFRSRRRSIWRDIILIVCVFFITLAVFLSFATTFSTSLNPTKNEALRKTVYYSPILDEVEIPSFTTMMNGTFFSPPNPSFTRQEPGPENDAIWMDYTDTTIFGLSREEVIKLGKDPDQTARLDREYWGLSEDVYPAKFDISHEIHCVAMLREKAFADYPGYTPMKHRHSDGPRGWIHLSHCADMLVQYFLCNADPAILTMSYVEHQESPWPDFNINRQCRDYGTLMEWAKGREIDKTRFEQGAPQPKDSYVWPNPMLQFESGTLDFELGIPIGHHHQGEGRPELVVHDLH